MGRRLNNSFQYKYQCRCWSRCGQPIEGMAWSRLYWNIYYCLCFELLGTTLVHSNHADRHTVKRGTDVSMGSKDTVCITHEFCILTATWHMARVKAHDGTPVNALCLGLHSLVPRSPSRRMHPASRPTGSLTLSHPFLCTSHCLYSVITSLTKTPVGTGKYINPPHCRGQQKNKKL